jgi:hypothetical protein
LVGFAADLAPSLAVRRRLVAAGWVQVAAACGLDAVRRGADVRSRPGGAASPDEVLPRRQVDHLLEARNGHRAGAGARGRSAHA